MPSPFVIPNSLLIIMIIVRAGKELPIPSLSNSDHLSLVVCVLTSFLILS